MQTIIRKSAVFYLLLLVLLKVLAVPAVYLHYQLNKAYIAAKLCENKGRPVMQCNGKCQLRKQLAKTSDTSNSQSQQVNSSFNFVDYCEGMEDYTLLPASSALRIFNSRPVTSIAQGYYGTVFHPPIA